MAFSKKGNMSPEEWLKEEATWQLEKIIDALNAAHTMPFHCTWLERDFGRDYLEMLKGMESLLLMIWSQLNSSSISNICLLYTSPSPRDGLLSRMPSSA